MPKAPYKPYKMVHVPVFCEASDKWKHEFHIVTWNGDHAAVCTSKTGGTSLINTLNRSFDIPQYRPPSHDQLRAEIRAKLAKGELVRPYQRQTNPKKFLAKYAE